MSYSPEIYKFQVGDKVTFHPDQSAAQFHFVGTILGVTSTKTKVLCSVKWDDDGTVFTYAFNLLILVESAIDKLEDML